MLQLTKSRNPLAFVFWATIITLPFWLIYMHKAYGVAIAVVLADIAFLALYLRRSRFAWHLATVLNIAFTIYSLVGGRHLRVDIEIYAMARDVIGCDDADNHFMREVATTEVQTG